MSVEDAADALIDAARHLGYTKACAEWWTDADWRTTGTDSLTEVDKAERNLAAARAALLEASP